MKIFITDKYRIITFFTVCCAVCAAALFFRGTNSLETFSERRIPIYSVKRDDKKIAVTFDCAWGADDIDSIISVLEENDCKATFFVLGTWAEKYPEAVLKLNNAGHEIGNHSYNHACYTSLSEDKMLEDMKRCGEAVEKACGKSPALFRAPAGDYNNSVLDVCEKAGLTYIQWSVDSLDWRGLSCGQMLERIIPKTKSGDILLFHNDTAHTAESLDKILKELKKNGFSFLKVSDLIYKENYTIDHTGRQVKN